MTDAPNARPQLGKKFVMRTLTWEAGFRDQVLSACGSQSAYGLAMGDALFQHSCGIWGLISGEDCRLNEQVLGAWRDGRTCGRWVMSRQQVAGFVIGIVTDLPTGETVIRRPANNVACQNFIQSE